MATARQQSDPAQGLGERIKKLREQRGWKQEELARHAGVSKSAISEVESDTTQPRGPNLVRLASALGASLDYLLTGQERPTPPPPPVVEVPAELAGMAKKWGIPYSHVELLMQFHGQIEAMRRDQPAHQFSEKDWEDLYEGVRPVLEKILGGKSK
jgi:transcriptional regulator with XRE-family HTH domain